MEQRIRETRTGRWIVEVQCGDQWHVDSCMAQAADSFEAAQAALPPGWDGQIVRLSAEQRANVPAERAARHAAQQARREQRQAMQAEIERLRAEAAALLLTPDGQRCRPDVWEALRPYAANTYDDEPVCLMALARRFSPAGSSELFLQGMETELQSWLGCVVDEFYAAE